MIRLAINEDLSFLTRHDSHIPVELLQRKIANSQVYVATLEDGEVVGWLRYGMFWDLIPFMNMLYILEPHRRRGIGRQLVEMWEQDMHEQGYERVLTSTFSSEEAQHFYRRLGYVDTGALLLPDEPTEIMLRKDLS